MAQPASGQFSLPPNRRVRNPLSATAVETAVARTAAGFGVAFLLQSLPAMLAQQSSVNPLYFAFSVGFLVAGLIFAGVAAIVRRLVRVASISFCVIYLVLLISWPFAALDPTHAPTASPWLYYLLTIATAMAAVGFGLRIAVIYLLVVPATYAFIRTTPAGGNSTPTQAALDGIYAFLLGAIITIIFFLLRNAARSVDRAQETALARYSHAVRAHAIEAERVQVDAIVHDSVLTTFLSAARAYTADAMRLAATMAENTIGYLRDAVATSPDADSQVNGGIVAARISSAAGSMATPFVVTTVTPELASIPISAAEALYSAAVQSMVNSLQHAGGDDVERWVSIEARKGGAFLVQIGDDGVGFDVSVVPAERLGVRVSIVERLAAAGGRASIASQPGAGTTITLNWPDRVQVAGSPEFAGSVAEAESEEGGRA